MKERLISSEFISRTYKYSNHHGRGGSSSLTVFKMRKLLLFWLNQLLLLEIFVYDLKCSQWNNLSWCGRGTKEKYIYSYQSRGGFQVDRNFINFIKQPAKIMRLTAWDWNSSATTTKKRRKKKSKTKFIT